MSNFPSKRTAPKTYTRFSLDKSTPSLWRVTFDNPPINLIDSVMIRELGELFAEVERNEGPAVLLFDSVDPDYFLAHYDITAANRSLVDSLPAGPNGFHPWVDIVVRLGKLPAVTISAIRGRARGAGSEFALATDIRFASRERALLGQMEVGFGAVPGAGPASWLPRLVGRGRAFEILVGGEDFDGELAERYGYVNRAIPDGQFADFVDRFAHRVATFDRQALADIKHFVNDVSLPEDAEFPPQMDAFWQAVARPALQARAKKMFELGLQQRSDVELRLAEHVGQFRVDGTQLGESDLSKDKGGNNHEQDRTWRDV
jgi:enoyl-CoA hydratase/carnithine racemase